jgi:hypothetical protein
MTLRKNQPLLRCLVSIGAAPDAAAGAEPPAAAIELSAAV